MRKLLIALLSAAACLCLSLFFVGCAQEAADPLPRYIVMLEQNDAFTIVGEHSCRVDAGGSASFLIRLQEGFEVESVEGGKYDVENGAIVCSDVHRHTTLRVNTVAQDAPYTVRYDLNGGTAAENGQLRYLYRSYDPSIRLRVNTPIATEVAERDGYTLAGWNTSADGSGTHIGLGSRVTLDEEKTVNLYAEWKAWTGAEHFATEPYGEGVAIADYTGTAREIVIPAVIGSLRVVHIAADAFADADADAIVFPLSLKSVADNAFRRCSAQSVCIFDDIESIGEGAFADCGRLETLLINAAEPPRYTSYWTGCWADKYDRILLADPDEKQMVFFSGSSMSNGLNSAMVDESFGYEYKVTNLGLSYLIDPTLQFEILLQTMHEGDILIHAPEDLSDVESLCDFNSLTWRVLEFNYDLLRYADIGEHNDVFDTFTEYNEQRQDLPANSYDEGAEEYNEYGDLAVFRPNTDDTDKGYDTFYDGEMLRPEILQELDGHYVELLEKGIVVYFSYGPANLDGEKMPPIYERYRYAGRIEAYIVSVPIISSMEAYLYDGRYFSNTNFHLSTEGANMRTEQLIADIRQQMIKDGLLTEADAA